MSRRSRLAWYGSAAMLVVLGAASAAVLGSTGQVVAFVLIALGLVLATSLVFLEIGLSEDRDRARDQKAASRKRSTRRKPGRLDRSRGHRRRLR